jgi:hypothetical protein
LQFHFRSNILPPVSSFKSLTLHRKARLSINKYTNSNYFLWDRRFKSYFRHSCLFAFLIYLCWLVRVISLRRGWSPFQGVLPAVNKIKPNGNRLKGLILPHRKSLSSLTFINDSILPREFRIFCFSGDLYTFCVIRHNCSSEVSAPWCEDAHVMWRYRYIFVFQLGTTGYEWLHSHNGHLIWGKSPPYWLYIGLTCPRKINST